jgi:hypothetical protein
MLHRAEALYAEGSFSLAHDLYAELRASQPPPPDVDARFVELRYADTMWRAQAGSATSDPSIFEQARSLLEALAPADAREEDRDDTWADAHESLGDFFWTRRETRNWEQAWSHYGPAFEHWAGSADVDPARERYLGIIRRAATAPGVEAWQYGNWYAPSFPVAVLENGLKIADNDRDRAHLSYLLAMSLRGSASDRRTHRRTHEAFEAAIAPGKGTGWYDDALFGYAQWTEGMGAMVRMEGGTRAPRPDYSAALDLYRRLTTEFRKGESRWFDQAQERILDITKPAVSLMVSSIFLPGSEAGFTLGWRNVGTVSLSLHRIDLTAAPEPRGNDAIDDWSRLVPDRGAAPIRSWNHETGDKGDHFPGSQSLAIERKLDPGAYLLRAAAGVESAHELVLVTADSLVLKSSPRKVLVFMADARDGSPRAGARITLWLRPHSTRDGSPRWKKLTGMTREDGLAHFEIPERETGGLIFAAAADGDHQAFASGYWGYAPPPAESWKIQAFTDRPAYRPEERVRWKLVARRQGSGGYMTPAGSEVAWEIADPRGAKVAGGTVTLNAFGSAWGELELTPAMALGQYMVSFRPAGEGSTGRAPLFRLEEYKLPEFRVEVSSPMENGRPKTWLAGERVEAEVTASYYFGGAVAEATVEVLVTQKPFHIWWQPRREYPWLYAENAMHGGFYGGDGQIIHRETLQTDADGKARVTIETPGGTSQDLEFTIEARVTDASRREITGSGTVRAGRQRYYVFPRPKHNIYGPGDEVTIEIKAVDALERPVRASGRVTVTRETWVEIWIDPTGREVTGSELARLRRSEPVFPLPPKRGAPGWSLHFQGYEHEEILERPVRTTDDGTAGLSFRAAREGYYRVAWLSEPDDDLPVRGETTVWVADRNSREIGYRHGGLGIILDKDTFQAGRRAPIMLTAPTAGSWILFTVEADDLDSYELVHLEGTVKLMEIDLDDRHVPNIFLDAAMVENGQLFVESQQVLVPPDRHFLEVEVSSDRAEYQPRETGTLTVTTRDHEGKPVAAEVALGLVDASVLYIQQDLTADPREFFFGTLRSRTISTSSTFSYRSYAIHEDRQADGAARFNLEIEASGTADRRDKNEMAKTASAEFGQAMPVIGRGFQDALALKSGLTSNEAGARRTGIAFRLEGANISAGGGEVTVQVRSDFRSTAFWQPDIVTEPDGTATVQVTFPDSLTTWKATARAASRSSQFGQGEAEARTRKPLIVRLQAPRFFVVGDRVTLSAIINNNTDGPVTVTPLLEATGLAVTGSPGAIEVAANGEARVDWQAEAIEAGEALLRVTARGGDLADAMEKRYPVHEHGVEKLMARSGKLRDGEVIVRLDLPAARRAGSTSLTVRVAPSMAVTMLDALPYLIDYPYGCTEQTMSRFLPAVLVSRTLADLGLDPGDVAGRIFGGIEPEHEAATHGKGKKELALLDDVARRGLDRLYDFQHGDGGWGWWKEGESDHFMTAYVVWGLGLARAARIDIRDGALRNGAAFLDRELVEQEENPDMQAWMLHALSSLSQKGSITEFQKRAFDNLFEKRSNLNAYSRALLALGAWQYGDAGRAQILIRNLVDGVKRDEAPDTSILMKGRATDAGVMGTAHWGEDGIAWRWSQGKIEATSFALRALLAIDPDNELIEPVTNWLVRNRRGAQWSNTRDTAMALMALTDYLKTSGELGSELEYTLEVNGRSVGTRRVGAGEPLSAPATFTVDPALLRDGTNEIRIARISGNGPLYFSAEAEFFSTEEPVTPAGNEIFVRRDLLAKVGTPTLLKGYTYRTEPLMDEGTVTSGDRVEVVLTIEAKNDYEYLVFEDLKAAGMEAVQLRSGEGMVVREIRSSAREGAAGDREAGDYTGRSRRVHQELRDRKTAFFIDKLPEGLWEIRYELRAEVPGRFHALPVLGHAMYVPEIRANGAEARIEVLERN